MARVPRPRVGAMIKQRRQQLGMKTQAALAARIYEQTGLRVSRTTVANWEADIHYPKRYIGAIEAVLGGLDGTEEVYADPAEAALWAMDRYSPEERRQMIADIREARRRAAS